MRRSEKTLTRLNKRISKISETIEKLHKSTMLLEDKRDRTALAFIGKSGILRDVCFELEDFDSCLNLSCSRSSEMSSVMDKAFGGLHSVSLSLGDRLSLSVSFGGNQFLAQVVSTHPFYYQDALDVTRLLGIREVRPKRGHERNMNRIFESRVARARLHNEFIEKVNSEEDGK